MKRRVLKQTWAIDPQSTNHEGSYSKLEDAFSYISRYTTRCKQHLLQNIRSIYKTTIVTSHTWGSQDHWLMICFSSFRFNLMIGSSIDEIWLHTREGERERERVMRTQPGLGRWFRRLVRLKKALREHPESEHRLGLANPHHLPLPFSSDSLANC